MSKIKHFLSITDLTSKQLLNILNISKDIKRSRSTSIKPLKNKHLTLVFEKPSLRTRLSFEVGIFQLDGTVSFFAAQEIGWGERESYANVVGVISKMSKGLIVRTFAHSTLEQLARYSSIPIINALSDLEHPCQALADFLTILEHKGKLKGLNLAYVGDGENNVPHSLALAAALLGVNFSCASPKGYSMNPEIVKKAKELAKKTKAVIIETKDPKHAVRNADVVYTDTWVSMGDESQKQVRLKIFSPYQVDIKLMSLAKKDVIFMHDMPAHRGNEVSTEVIDGPNSVIFDQAENRLHAQKGLLAYLFR